MIGGIFCQCDVGGIYHPRTVDSINDRCYMYFGAGMIPESILKGIIIETLLRSATYAMKYVSSTQGRDFKNDSMDLMKSMGVAVYERGMLVAKQRYSASKAHREAQIGETRLVKDGFLGKLGVKEFVDHDRSYHPDPNDRFESFIKRMGVFYRNTYSVAFVATMPYAVRLEHKRVSGITPAGGFEKRVLIGNINSVVNAFYRKVGVDTPQKRTYGYYFEAGSSNTPEVIQRT